MLVAGQQLPLVKETGGRVKRRADDAGDAHSDGAAQAPRAQAGGRAEPWMNAHSKVLSHLLFILLS